MKMKLLRFVGSSLDDLRNFPDEARRAAGFELHAVQSGFEPSDWKPLPIVGSGAREIRIHILGGVAGCICRQASRSGLCASCLSKENEKNR